MLLRYCNTNFHFVCIVKPAIQGDSIENKEVVLHQMGYINCPVSGNPKPTILWYKDGTELLVDNHNTFVENENQKLIVLKLDKADSGVYSCLAKNTVGYARRDINLTVLSKDIFYYLLSCNLFSVSHLLINNNNCKNIVKLFLFVIGEYIIIIIFNQLFWYHTNSKFKINLKC